jgi:hypothetical protein
MDGKTKRPYTAPRMLSTHIAVPSIFATRPPVGPGGPNPPSPPGK